VLILPLHGVFLAYLALLLAWNVAAARPPGQGSRRGGLAATAVLAAQVVLTAVLVRDRLAGAAPSLLQHPAVAFAFPLAYLAALGQNLGAMRARGARLTDVPVMLHNVGLGACVGSAALALHGRGGDPVLLYDHAVLQHLLGSHLAHVGTLSWHLPVLARRRDAATLPGAVAGLLGPAFCGFVVLMLVLFHPEATDVVVMFDDEPSGAVRADLDIGVLARPGASAPAPAGPAPPGSLAAWELPADHPGQGLPRDGRPLVLLMRAPDAWLLSRPTLEQRQQAFLDGAERLARVLQPAVLAPFPEPDGEAPLVFGEGLPPGTWRALYARAGQRVRAASPDTRVAARLGGTGAGSHLIFQALAAPPAVVDVLGPRLHPGSAARGGPSMADATLAEWRTWRAALDSPPAFWVLGAGLSPLAFGSRAQARFLDGCLSRASADDAIEGLIVLAWRDRGGTLGLLGPGDVPREAAVMLERRLGR
jgi:hypothetical protein